MTKFKFPGASSVKDLLLHLLIISGLILISLVVFFYLFLPLYTNHGESLTVPNLVGMELEELDEFLIKRDLRYEVLPDSGYSATYSPLTVLQQTPKANSKVKENRKVYLILNAKNPPEVKIPDIIDSSLRNALNVLKSNGLEVGEIKYRAYPFQNAVMSMWLEDKELKPGDVINKGSVIDLVVGDGAGSPFPVPEVVNMTLEDARFVIVGSGLKVGTIKEDFSSIKPAGTILQQFPEPGENLRNGQKIDLWVSATSDESILN